MISWNKIFPDRVYIYVKKEFKNVENSLFYRDFAVAKKHGFL